MKELLVHGGHGGVADVDPDHVAKRERAHAEPRRAREDPVDFIEAGDALLEDALRLGTKAAETLIGEADEALAEARYLGDKTAIWSERSEAS